MCATYFSVWPSDIMFTSSEVNKCGGYRACATVVDRNVGAQKHNFYAIRRAQNGSVKHYTEIYANRKYIRFCSLICLTHEKQAIKRHRKQPSEG